MRLVIDRFEGDYAVCEKSDRTMVNIRRSLLPPDAREGDIINVNGNRITLIKDETEKRKADIDKMMDYLWR